jgi:hypothetical protein
MTSRSASANESVRNDSWSSSRQHITAAQKPINRFSDQSSCDVENSQNSRRLSYL